MLTKEQKDQLWHEGLTARIRNLITSVKFLFDCIGDYYKIQNKNSEDSKKLLSCFDILKEMQPRIEESFSTMKDLAKEMNNVSLSNKLQKLTPLLRDYKSFIEEKVEDLRKDKAFKFDSRNKEHDEIIREIVEASAG